MLTVIGIGPGSEAMMTEEAVTALKEAEVVVGYKNLYPSGETSGGRQRSHQNRHAQRDRTLPSGH